MGGMLEGGGDAGRRGIKGRKKWDNCNSMINKIHFKKYTLVKSTIFSHLQDLCVILNLVSSSLKIYRNFHELNWFK